MLSNIQILHSLGSFENQVSQGLDMMTGRHVFIKRYSDSVRFNTESIVLHGLAGNTNVPEILYEDRDERILVMGKLPGDHFKVQDAHNLGVRIKVLHSRLHNIQGLSSQLNTQDYTQRLALFRERIIFTPSLDQYFSDGDIGLIMKALSHIEKSFGDESQKGKMQIIHGDIKPENLLEDRKEGLSFIDFESTTIGTVEFELARVYWRILDCNNDSLRVLTEGYGLGKENLDLILIKSLAILDCLGAISYFLYKGHLNNYPFHRLALSTLKLLLKGS